MSSSAAPSTFTPSEVFMSVGLALAVETAIFLLWAFAGAGRAHVKAAPIEEPKEVPIAVKPVMDDAPLLKLGGKKKAKLPDMWKKQAPVQRFEETSAPSAKASKTPEALPSSKLAKPDASAPPPDAEIAKEVEQTLTEPVPSAQPTAEGDGAADGVKEGTETDPLKARAVSAYRAKLIAWFDARFRPPDPPADKAACEELKKLSSSVTVTIGGDRSVAGYSVGRPSGNGPFDERVRTMLDGAKGEILPPPPPLYPDILNDSLPLRLTGQKIKCE